MKNFFGNFDFQKAQQAPGYISAVTALNPSFGKSLADAALMTREQETQQMQKEKHEFEKQKQMRDQQQAEALLQNLGDIDWANPNVALQQLQAKNLPADLAYQLIGKNSEIAGAKEGRDIQREQLGISRGHLGVDQAKLEIERQKAAVAAEGRPDAEQEYKIGKDLREAGAKAAQNYKFVHTAAKNVRALAKIGNGLSDTGMLYNTVNVLDPGNSVREGDVITVKTAPGLSESTIGYLNSLRGKGGFTQKTRDELVQLVNTVEGNHLEAVKNTNKENTRLAKSYKIRPENVLYPLEEDAEDFKVNSQSAPGNGFTQEGAAQEKARRLQAQQMGR